MRNSTSTMVHLDSITGIRLFESTGSQYLSVDSGTATIMLDEKEIEIKVGGNKVKVSMYEFMQAFKDLLDTGVFELDQIDSEVWDIENKLEVLGNQNNYLSETLREIRGGC